METRKETAKELKKDIDMYDDWCTKEIAEALKTEWELTYKETEKFCGTMNPTCRDIKEALKIISEVV